MYGKIGRKKRLVHAQSIGLGCVRSYSDARQWFFVIGANQIDAFYLMHAGCYFLGCCLQIPDTVAAHPYFDRIGGVIVIHLFETDIAVRKIVGIAVGISVEHFFCSAVINCIYDKLCKVRSANLRRICGMETR